MNKQTKTNAELIEEISSLKQRIQELEQAESERKRTEEELQDTLESLRKAVGATIQVMVSAVEARDPYTAGHQIRSANRRFSKGLYGFGALGPLALS